MYILSGNQYGSSKSIICLYILLTLQRALTSTLYLEYGWQFLESFIFFILFLVLCIIKEIFMHIVMIRFYRALIYHTIQKKGKKYWMPVMDKDKWLTSLWRASIVTITGLSIQLHSDII